MLIAQAKERDITLATFLKKNFCRIGNKSLQDLIYRIRLLRYFDESGFFAGDIVKRIAQSGKIRKLKKNKKR